MTTETDAPQFQHNIARGIPAIIGGVFLFSFADVLGKWFGIAGYDSVQIVFFRYLFGLICVGVALAVTGTEGLKTKHPWMHVLRGIYMFAALTLFFRGLKTLPLAEAIAVAFSAPLFVTALSWPMLKERVGPYRWAAVIIGFIGALVILRPGTNAFRPEALYVVASAFFFALAMLHTRRISRTETNVAIYAYSTICAGLMTVPFLPFVWVEPETTHLWLFLLLGLIGGVASYLMIIAYRYSPAAVNAPFDYTALIWGAIMGWVIWEEKPDMIVWVGAFIIVGAGLTITYRESRVGIATPRRGR